MMSRMTKNQGRRERRKFTEEFNVKFRTLTIPRHSGHRSDGSRPL